MTAQHGSATGPRVAVVDIGTNSVRVLVADVGPQGISALDRRLWLTRLGQGVDRSGCLAEEAIERTVAAVGEAAAIWQRHGADRVRITATSAARDARNAEQLVDGIRRVAGQAPEVISGQEEAALALRGALAGLPAVAAGQVLVVDIGGGSTEMILGGGGADGGVAASTSRQLGSVRLTERHLADDPPAAGQIAAARDLALTELRAGRDALGLTAPFPGVVVAVAGTATTVGAIALELDGYDPVALHGAVLDRATLAAVADELLSTSVAHIADSPAVEAGREDVIAGGALILHAVAQVLDVGGVTICTTDLLDGLAIDLASR